MINHAAALQCDLLFQMSLVVSSTSAVKLVMQPAMSMHMCNSMLAASDS